MLPRVLNIGTALWICCLGFLAFLFLVYQTHSQHDPYYWIYPQIPVRHPPPNSRITSHVGFNSSIATNVKTVNMLPQCPEKPPGLAGALDLSLAKKDSLKELDVIRMHPELKTGGAWKPPFCTSRHKIAVIIPFRDRQSHLTRLLAHIIPILQRQWLDFRFLVAEQYGSDLFNKGKLLNAAFTVAEQFNVDCVVFHDVDMLPMSDRMSYGCYEQPTHLGAYVDTLKFDLWYHFMTGGIVSFRRDHFKLVNGYSNLYWAWGGEDDDMGRRVLGKNLTIQRLAKDISKTVMIRHKKRHRTKPKIVFHLLRTAVERTDSDGLRNGSWSVMKLMHKPLYHHIFVDVGNAPKDWSPKESAQKTVNTKSQEHATFA